MSRWVQVVLLAVVMDAFMPTVGAFTAQLPPLGECETATPAEVSESGLEVELALPEAPRATTTRSSSSPIVVEELRFDEGHSPRVFRPPIAA